MKAEDTMFFMGNPQIMPGIYHPQQELLRQQAEISFKAGIQEVEEWVEKHYWKRVTTREEWESQKRVWGL